MDSESSLQQQQLRARNAQLEEELDLLRGVLVLVKEDLHVKNDQIDHLYHTFLASKEHKRQEQEQRENALKQQVGELETQIRAKELSFQRLHNSLQCTTKLLQISRNANANLTDESHLHELPAVLVVNVLSYLDTRCIVRAGRTHRNLYAVVMQTSFWEGMYALRWRRSDEKQGFCRVRMFAAKYLKDTSEQHKTDDPSQGGDKPLNCNAKANESIDWTALYRERHGVERNWASGKAVITTLNGHNGTVTCLQFNDSRLVSGSDDGSMMLWSLSPPEEESASGSGSTSPHHGGQEPLMQQHHRQRKSVVKLHSFFGHGGPVWALHFQDSTLISGSYDKTVKIWDLQTGKCNHTLRGHTGWVSSLDSHERLIASASWDSSINVWDLDSGALVRTLMDSPANPIYSLQWDHVRNAFITGCRRFGVQLWDVESGQKIAHFVGHNAKNQVNIVKACNERIISGGSDHSVKIWDRRQGACTTTLLGHKGAVMSVDYDHDHKVISGSYDSVIKQHSNTSLCVVFCVAGQLWDLRQTSSPVSTFEGHSSAVFSLQMDATKMISGSADTTIKIFRFL